MRTGYKILLILSILLVSQFQVIQAQKIDYIKIPELEKILGNAEDKLFVVNLWATWCGPCVKELPVFEKAAKDYDPSQVNFILVSLDFPSQIEKQLIPFLKKNNITLDVAVMIEMDYNLWIDKIDPEWQGDIPATLIFNNSGKIRHFHPGELSESELRDLINKYI